MFVDNTMGVSKRQFSCRILLFYSTIILTLISFRYIPDIHPSAVPKAFHHEIPNGSTNWPFYEVSKVSTCLESSESVFIGVLSTASSHYNLRREIARKTWMTWATTLGFTVKFFVEAPESSPEQNAITDEMMKYQDIVLIDRSFLNSPGSIWNKKAMWVMQYGLSHGNFSYLIRTDDDSFWCLHRLRFVLNFLPRRNLMMAHYFDNHTDVQFVASRDVAKEYVVACQLGLRDVTWGLDDVSYWWSPSIKICNEWSMTMGKHKRGNLVAEGWFAPEELPLGTQASFCSRFIANHQSYPPRMKHTFESTRKWSELDCNTMYDSMFPLNCRSGLFDGS